MEELRPQGDIESPDLQPSRPKNYDKKKDRICNHVRLGRLGFWNIQFFLQRPRLQSPFLDDQEIKSENHKSIFTCKLCIAHCTVDIRLAASRHMSIACYKVRSV